MSVKMNLTKLIFFFVLIGIVCGQSFYGSTCEDLRDNLIKVRAIGVSQNRTITIVASNNQIVEAQNEHFKLHPLGHYYLDLTSITETSTSSKWPQIVLDLDSRDNQFFIFQNNVYSFLGTIHYSNELDSKCALILNLDESVDESELRTDECSHNMYGVDVLQSHQVDTIISDKVNSAVGFSTQNGMNERSSWYITTEHDNSFVISFSKSDCYFVTITKSNSAPLSGFHLNDGLLNVLIFIYEDSSVEQFILSQDGLCGISAASPDSVIRTDEFFQCSDESTTPRSEDNDKKSEMKHLDKIGKNEINLLKDGQWSDRAIVLSSFSAAIIVGIATFVVYKLYESHQAQASKKLSQSQEDETSGKKTKARISRKSPDTSEGEVRDEVEGTELNEDENDESCVKSIDDSGDSK